MCRRSACRLSTLAICPSSSWRRAIWPRPTPNSARASAATESTTSSRTAWSTSASSKPLSRWSVSESVDGVRTRIFSVNARSAVAFASRSCAASSLDTPYAEGNTFAAICATRAPENFCSVSTNTTPASRPPKRLGAAAATASVRQNCVLPAPAGPTSSVIDPVGTPPPSAESSARRNSPPRTYAGPADVETDAAPGSLGASVAARGGGGAASSARGGVRADAAREERPRGRGLGAHVPGDGRHHALRRGQRDVQELHEVQRRARQHVLRGAEVVALQLGQGLHVQAGDARQRAMLRGHREEARRPARTRRAGRDTRAARLNSTNGM